MLRPLRSKWPLWQAHQMWPMSSRYWTMQFRCVQVAENALSSPEGVRIRMPARFPNLTVAAALKKTARGK